METDIDDYDLKKTGAFIRALSGRTDIGLCQSCGSSVELWCICNRKYIL